MVNIQIQMKICDSRDTAVFCRFHRRRLTRYPRRERSALGVDTVLTLDVCMFVC